METKRRKLCNTEDKPIFVASLDICSIDELDLLVKVYGNSFLNKRDENNNTIFHTVCMHDDLKTLMHLDKKYGLNLVAINDVRKTAFKLACEHGSQKCLTYMLAIDKYVSKIKNYIDILDFLNIIKKCSVWLIKKFVDTFGDVLVNLRSVFGRNILMLMIFRLRKVSPEVRDNIKIAFSYIVEKTNIDLEYVHEKRTIIEYLFEEGFIEILDYLATNNKGPAWKYMSLLNKPTLLHFFYKEFFSHTVTGSKQQYICEKIPLLCKFLKSHPHINRALTGFSGINIFHFLINEKRSGYIPFIYPHFENCLNNKNGIGNTPLCTASQNEDVKAIRLLLKYKNLDVNAQNNYGNTALMIACKVEASRIVKLLIENERYKVDVNIQNDLEETAFMIACRLENSLIIKILVENEKCEVDVNYQNQDGDTALMLACLFEKYYTVKALSVATKKINPNLKNKKGETALSLACQTKNNRVLSALLQFPNLCFDIEESKRSELLIKAVAEKEYDLAKKILEYIRSSPDALKIDSLDKFLKDLLNNDCVCVTADELTYFDGSHFPTFENLYNFYSKTPLKEGVIENYVSEMEEGEDGKRKENNECCICMENNSDMLFKPCEHKCCSKCILNMSKHSNNLVCHLCREKIGIVVKVII